MASMETEQLPGLSPFLNILQGLFAGMAGRPNEPAEQAMRREQLLRLNKLSNIREMVLREDMKRKAAEEERLNKPMGQITSLQPTKGPVEPSGYMDINPEGDTWQRPVTTPGMSLKTLMGLHQAGIKPNLPGNWYQSIGVEPPPDRISTLEAEAAAKQRGKVSATPAKTGKVIQSAGQPFQDNKGGLWRQVVYTDGTIDIQPVEPGTYQREGTTPTVTPPGVPPQTGPAPTSTKETPLSFGVGGVNLPMAIGGLGNVPSNIIEKNIMPPSVNPVPSQTGPVSGVEQTSLSPQEENMFQGWYSQIAQQLGLNPNPDDPLHQYDYRAAYQTGAKPDASGHWPSTFKKEGHPNLIVGGMDTRTGLPALQPPPQPTPVPAPPETYGLRPDKTKKGTGFLGELKRPDGRVSTELSIGVTFDGKETLIPTLVPTLDKDEIDYLLKSPTNSEIFKTPIGQRIMKKAIEHARSRITTGMSPFAQEGEKPAAPPSTSLPTGLGTVRKYPRQLEGKVPSLSARAPYHKVEVDEATGKTYHQYYDWDKEKQDYVKGGRKLAKLPGEGAKEGGVKPEKIKLIRQALNERYSNYINSVRGQNIPAKDIHNNLTPEQREGYSRILVFAEKHAEKLNPEEAIDQALKDYENTYAKGNKSGLKDRTKENKNVEYKTAEDVKTAYKGGKVTKEQATKILKEKFGFE